MHTALDRFLATHFSSVSNYASYDEPFLQDFLKLGPLHHFIPASHGGCFNRSIDCMELLDTVSYYCLPLGLALGITGSLFLRPIARLASEDLRRSIFPRFIKHTDLGGMMITEPTGGTDIFGLRSTLEMNTGRVRLNGDKCWGGLTGRAEHWLVAARIKKGDLLTRRVAMVYVPLASPGIHVEHYFDALGLQPISYGTTRYTEVDLPESHIITSAGGSALRDILDTLMRSRMGIAAIAAGQCRRLVDEVVERANHRITFGRTLSEYDQVQYRISGLRAWQQINQALWHFNGMWSDLHADVSGDQVLANSSKVIASEGLSTAADSAVQLFASAAYKRTHVVGRAFTDARPFQIFEGSNDVLHENSYDVLVSRHGRVDTDTVGLELQRYGLTLPADVMIRDALNHQDGLSQRKKVHVGKMISWLIAQAILEHDAAIINAPIEDGLRLAKRQMAALAAEFPYLG